MPSPQDSHEIASKESTEKENFDDGKKKQSQPSGYHGSPRRKYVNRSNNNQNNRHNRNNSGNKRVNDQNNNKPQMSNFKSSQQPQSDYNNKKPQQKYRGITKNGNFQYETSMSAPPSLENEPIDNIDNNGRKYSMEFLHQVGYKMSNVALQSPKTPKTVDETKMIALKMALGDNSGNFTHFYSGSMYGAGNQMILQQHQQQFQSFQRYQPTQQQQQFQRIYGRNYQRWPVYEQDPGSLSCHCPQQIQQLQQLQQPQQQIHTQRSFQQYNSPVYHQRGKNNREYRDFRTDGKKHRNFQSAKSRDFRNPPQIIKSNSFTEDDSKRNNNNNSYRSLSPTPPGSSKSSSPGALEKNHEEDSASTSSGPSYTGEMKVSLSAPMLSCPEPAANVNLWIDSNFGGMHSGLSYSAEHLNVPQITYMKRQSSGKQSLLSLRSPSYDPQYPFEYYLARCDESDMRDVPTGFRTGSKYDRMTEQMWDRFQIYQQTRLTYHSKMIIWRDLYNAVKNFPLFHQRGSAKWGLFLVGSTISGFGSDTSDIDMCLVMKDNHYDRIDPRMEAMVTLNDLQTFLQNSMSPFQNFSLINAKVPILRFRDASNKIEIDLNYNNCIGVRNTQLLHSYSQLDWRLRPLALIVKLWAHFHNINDARNSTISSYSLVLMVIHFLQYAVKPAILPCLHDLCPDKFNALHDITTIDMVEKCEVNWKSENRQSLGELFLRFLDYYSNFDYTKNAISVRTGGVLSIEECKSIRSPKNDPNHWQTLCIEEPFDLTNTARSAYDGEVFRKIKDVFFGSFYRLKESRNLESVFRDPLFTQQHQQQQQFMMSQMKYIMAPQVGMPMSMAVASDVKS